MPSVPKGQRWAREAGRRGGPEPLGAAPRESLWVTDCHNDTVVNWDPCLRSMKGSSPSSRAPARLPMDSPGEGEGEADGATRGAAGRVRPRPSAPSARGGPGPPTRSLTEPPTRAHRARSPRAGSEGGSEEAEGTLTTPAPGACGPAC